MTTTIDKAFATAIAVQTGPGTVDIHEAGQRLLCALLAIEPLGCAVNRLEFWSPILARASIVELKSVSQNLSAKLSYLLEPISPIEVDAENCLVQMRSVPPDRNDDGTSYYELLVSRGQQGGANLSLVRYRKQPGQPRETVPAILTRQVLCRLAGDFASAKA